MSDAALSRTTPAWWASRRVGFLAAALVIAMLPMVLTGNYWQTNLTICAINVMLALGLDFILGYAGQLNLGQSPFYGYDAHGAQKPQFVSNVEAAGALEGGDEGGFVSPFDALSSHSRTPQPQTQGDPEKIRARAQDPLAGSASPVKVKPLKKKLKVQFRNGRLKAKRGGVLRLHSDSPWPEAKGGNRENPRHRPAMVFLKRTRDSCSGFSMYRKFPGVLLNLRRHSAPYGLPTRVPPPDCAPFPLPAGRESGMMPSVSAPPRTGKVHRRIAAYEAAPPGDDPHPQPTAE